MKVMCQKCGCHFEEEFNKTVRCGYWEVLGLQDLSKKNKEAVWKWLFSLPQDRIYGEDGIEIGFSMFGRKPEGMIKGENQFKKLIPEYKGWSEEQRKKFQKDYFKFMHNIPQEAYSEAMLKLFMETQK